MLMERTLMERTIDALDRSVETGIIGPYAVGGDGQRELAKLGFWEGRPHGGPA